MTFQEVASEITEIKALFQFFHDERAIYQRWEQLVQTHGVKGKKAHDTRLVAAMNYHEITHILTFNGDDFNRYSGIPVLTPDDMIQTAEEKPA